MKKINNYIQEALINKNTQIKTDIIDIDHLNNHEIILYNDQDSDDPETDWKDTEEDIYYIDQNYDYFVLCKYNSLSKIINTNKLDYIENVNKSLRALVKKVITGKDLGYEVRLQYGHLEIDCVNSGSRATYYIYALSEELYDNITDLFWGDEVDLKPICSKEESVIPIEIK